MKISAFLSKSHLDRSYELAKQSIGMFYSLHGKIALAMEDRSMSVFLLQVGYS